MIDFEEQLKKFSWRRSGIVLAGAADDNQSVQFMSVVVNALQPHCEILGKKKYKDNNWNWKKNFFF